ncbi:MAG: LicD family protein [Ligilactobacillus salivarius]|uniref:LicD family protein n=1 Tax=Ligilactobacillus salivarius TaxID=1624 RepID=UPI0011CBBA31|nr:LicD family protein [Ligilactobacillus salivarius]MCI6062863.1 LicD family protein [Ligilactobacillus salivarius]MDY5290962.1 LicD family protein [Ligilactobacillus salivarius]TXJ77691.1 LicD family protein [Ligilactobacillus salivarius]
MKLDTKTVQNLSLDILIYITDVCEKLNLRYYLMYGSLIGAVRHKGFIPWDDDVDIMMPREDYNQLLCFLKENIDKRYELFEPNTVSRYPYMIARISDKNYKIVMNNEEKYGMGIFIDIYPFDGVGNSLKEAKKIVRKGNVLSSMCYQATRKRYAVETTTSFIRQCVKFPVFIMSKIIGKEYFQNKLKKLENIKNYEESKYISCVVWASGGEKDIFKRSWFDSYIYMDFQKYRFRVPKDYDEVLKHTYGNYMKLPDEKDRIGHHYYEVEI